ncbi:MAG: DUF3243 family protein [Betaproteobacteria bacterium]
MGTDVDLGAFPQEVSEVIRDGLKHGVSDEQMVKGMISIGNLMGKFVRPDTPEEALMKEIWDVADESEKETLAKLVLKVGKRRVH